MGENIASNDWDRHRFLTVKTGDTVIVEVSSTINKVNELDWWMGHVLCLQSGARDPNQNSLFQVLNLDTGIIKWVNADLVTRVFASCAPDGVEKIT